MKLDVDELEQKAMRLATAAKVITDSSREGAPCDAVSELGFARHEYNFATPAPVTLALIARIRELEAAGRELGEMARMGYREDIYESREAFARRHAELADVLAKGVALS